jgi:hypothetical protein
LEDPGVGFSASSLSREIFIANHNRSQRFIEVEVDPITPTKILHQSIGAVRGRGCAAFGRNKLWI